ncbi:MAG: serine hydrolase [Patescibacteria group bacterium]
MLNFLTSLIIASLLIPSGFNFFTQKAADYSYRSGIVSNKAQLPKRIVNNSFGLKTTAKSILIIDDASGSVLYSKNPAVVSPLASISKLMTALVVLDNKPDWNKVVKMTKEDRRQGGINYLFDGQEVTVKDLFNLMLVASSNEAAIALARSSGPTNFVAAMNKKAKELGMTDTYFLDPSGLTPQNVSSAKDLIKLAQAAFSQPEIIKAVTSQEYRFKLVDNSKIVLGVSTDKLLDGFLNQGDYQIVGAKTGYLDEAGYCLLLKIKKKDTASLTIALMGAQSQPDRWQEAKGLVDWVFRNYQFN